MSADEHTFTVDWLLKNVTEPTAEDLEDYQITIPDGDLIELGNDIRSEKVITDCVRLFGIAAEHWNKIKNDPVQRRKLLGFSDGLLSVAVHANKTLVDMLAASKDTRRAKDAIRSAAQAAAQEGYQAAKNERERLSVALEPVVAGDVKLTERLDAARGRVVGAETLVSSLGDLVGLARELIQDPKSRIARKLIKGGITAEELDLIEAVAARLAEDTNQAEGARTRGAVSQTDLDRQDGICLTYLEMVMKIFNRANQGGKDKSVPRLVPIATRHIFAPRRARSAEAAPEAPQPATETAGPGASRPGQSGATV